MITFLSVALTLAMSQVYDYSFLLLFGAPRVCLWIEIRRYKNTIRIRIQLNQEKKSTSLTTLFNISHNAIIAILTEIYQYLTS